MTMNSPREASTYSRSSLTARCSPGSVLPAALSAVTARISMSPVRIRPPRDPQAPCDEAGKQDEIGGVGPLEQRHHRTFSELEEHHVGEADPGDVRQGGFRPVLALRRAVDFLVAPGTWRPFSVVPNELRSIR